MIGKDFAAEAGTLGRLGLRNMDGLQILCMMNAGFS
jgi:hypothetical protein